MKKCIPLLVLAFATLFMAACSSPEKMKKQADLVTTSCDPQVLEVRANVIEARYTVSFPEKYFHPKATLELTPVLVYQGGEVAGPVKLLQGEKVQGNNTVIPTVGGKIDQPVKFDYKPGMESSRLELRARVLYKDKVWPFDEARKLADGAIVTYKLLNTDGNPSMLGDKYPKTIIKTQEAQINYVVNSDAVRNTELRKEEIKALQDFLTAINEDERSQAKAMNIISAASPEGPITTNEPLAQKRGKTAETAYANMVKKLDKKAPINLTSISEDWDGFRELVAASDLQDKDLVLRVLSMYSDDVVREREIKNMSNVYKILKDKVLPELRRSRMIAENEWLNYTDEELKEMVSANSVEGLDVEGLLYAATLIDDLNTKISLYTKAAEKYNDYRAYNNLAWAELLNGNAAAAKTALAKASNQNDAAVKNNLGVVALRENRIEDAVKLFNEANNADAKTNIGAISILNGNYSDALNRYNGTNSYNEALSNLLSGNEDKATTILNSKDDAQSEYLKAIIAARKGNCTEVAACLARAYAKDPSLKEKAATDIEFAKCKGSL
ncbi:MAG: hypothetical protein FWH23_00980 [Bacteroidales bacterium]|nr:hypothetical protein [Bacteroidales bacterium]MCL2133146.1 hypothetical protein [Bacteroidales bacterium]